MSAFCDRWGFLVQWCEPLKNRISRHDCSMLPGDWNPEHILNVKMPQRVNYPTEQQFKVNFQKTREALALLAAVESVDYDAWRYLLQDHCHVDVGQEGEEKYENIRAKLYVKMDYSARLCADEPGAGDFDLVRLCGVAQREHATPEYQQTLEKITYVAKTFYAGISLLDVRIPVNVRLSDNPILAQVEDIVRAERVIKQQWEEYGESSEVPPGSPRCTFVLQPTELYFAEKRTRSFMNPQFVEILECLVQNNVWLSHVEHVANRRSCRVDSERESRNLVGRFTRSLFDSTRRSREDANTGYHFESEGRENANPLQPDVIEVRADYSTPDFYIEGLCSAMAVNQTSTHVSLDVTESSLILKQRLWFKWLAYGLFSPRAMAKSAWKYLVLNARNLSIDQSEAFSAIVTAEHPEEELFGSPEGQIAERDATLIDGAPIRWDFTDDGEPNLGSNTLISPTSIHAVRTFSDDGVSQWVNTIVPGLGRCQVRRCDLTFGEESGDNEQNAPGLKDLVITCNGFDYSGIPKFLQTIGSCLRSLTLWGDRPLQLDDTIIFQNCPNLDELCLVAGKICVKLIFLEHRKNGGSLSELNATNWHDIAKVSAALRDVENPVAKCLCKLRVNLTRQWTQLQGDYPPHWLEEALEPFVQILDVSKSLEYFEVVVLRQYQKHISGFLQHHLEALPQAHHFPVESKLAFLSVFSESTGRERKKRRRVSTGRELYRRELNEDTCSSIFAFAASLVLRRVYVTCGS